MKVPSKQHYSSRCGFTLVEVLVASALTAITSGILIYGLSAMNLQAMYARNMTGGAALLRGMTEMALTLPYDGHNVGEVEANLLRTTDGSGDDDFEVYGDPSAFSLADLAGTPDVETYSGLPVYVARDPGIISSSADPLAAPLVNGELAREVNPVTVPLAVDDSTTATNLGVIQVEYSLSYEFAGKQRNITVRTFRAPSR